MPIKSILILFFARNPKEGKNRDKLIILINPEVLSSPGKNVAEKTKSLFIYRLDNEIKRIWRKSVEIDKKELSFMKWRYIYGPVSSFRLGSSLGVDLLSQEEKICTFDCIYCQLGKNLNYSRQRRLYVSTKEVIEELERLPETQIDYITFSGRGEPTLAENLGNTIKAIKRLRKEPVAVLTNSSLMDRDDVREELLLADFVIAKLDTWSQKALEVINRPISGIKFDKIYNSIKDFRKEYKGKLALQIMFMQENKEAAAKLADLTSKINPDEVQINTPLRPCGVKPLSRKEIFKIKEYFKEMKTISVYDAKHKEVTSLNLEDTLRRRGKTI